MNAYLPSTPHGPWGYLDQRTLDAIRYWLANKAGADFLAVDGRDYPHTGPITSPLAATEKYAATTVWLRQQSRLPIWWMESHIQPPGSGWSDNQAAAIRVAALVQMASSGARVGMQWQPEQGATSDDDAGLWTSTRSPGGGQPTVLARILPGVLEVLGRKVRIVPGQPPGVLVASGPGGTIALNTTTAAAAAVVNGTRVPLGPGQVRVS